VILKAASEAADVSLSVHGSYYINLASDDKAKWHASISRIVQAATIGQLAGARSVTYHTGFFQKQTYDELKPTVIEGMRQIFTKLADADTTLIKIAPELTGKPTQVGDLTQLIDLVNTLQAEGFKQSALCIDFAHQYARHNGAFNTYDEFMHTIEQIDQKLGAEFRENLHIHVSGIAYTPKGESHHLTYLRTLDEYRDQGVDIDGIQKEWDLLGAERTTPNEFNWQDLLKAFKTSDVGGFVVGESPIMELDAKLMQNYYHAL
jgi:deoxyribonuclease-4